MCSWATLVGHSPSFITWTTYHMFYSCFSTLLQQDHLWQTLCINKWLSFIINHNSEMILTEIFKCEIYRHYLYSNTMFWGLETISNLFKELYFTRSFLEAKTLFDTG